MRIAHCQFESWCGEFDHNLLRFEEGLQKAEEERAAVVSFPECFLTGYPDNEPEVRRGAFAVDSEKMARLLDITSRHEPLAIVGFNDTTKGPDQAWGLSKSAWSHREFHTFVAEAAAALPEANR